MGRKVCSLLLGWRPLLGWVSRRVPGRTRHIGETFSDGFTSVAQEGNCWGILMRVEDSAGYLPSVLDAPTGSQVWKLVGIPPSTHDELEVQVSIFKGYLFSSFFHGVGVSPSLADSYLAIR